jgi:GTP cyclohydrolase FolE2
MCNCVLKNERICTNEPSKERCKKHHISKFPRVITNEAKAEIMMEKILKSRLHESVVCPCSSTMKRWNYAHHCQTKKHKVWAALMPSSENGHSWRSRTLTEIEKESTEKNRAWGQKKQVMEELKTHFMKQ